MINVEKCIGCQACVDFCVKQAILFRYNEWGEGRAVVDQSRCINCGLCDSLCPNINIKFNKAQTTVFAAVSNNNHHTGSSGGVFFELASCFINEGGVVFGAAFNDDLKLVHQKCTTISELAKICKSKYLHSDMTGIYNQISECLRLGKKVMFVGTPCQVSAVKNTFSMRFKDQLLLIDFLCHGTGTQKIFDLCIHNEEEKQKGKITDFSFRAKTRKAEHSFQYTVTSETEKRIISGFSFEFPYYYSYLKYTIFSDSCYECKYPRSERVGDITLGDFWGIQNYNKKLHDQNGVSMLSVNTKLGKQYFEKVRVKCVAYEYPIENALEKNQAFRERVCVCSYNKKKELASILNHQGEAALVERLSCPNIKKQIVYAKTPMFIKKVWNRVRGIR